LGVCPSVRWRCLQKGGRLLFNECLWVKVCIAFDLEKCLVSLRPQYGACSDRSKPGVTLIKRRQTPTVSPNSQLCFSFGVCSLARCISSVIKAPVIVHQVFLNSVPSGSGLCRMYDMWYQPPNFVYMEALRTYFHQLYFPKMH
jgi:hypothetical protein